MGKLVHKQHCSLDIFFLHFIYYIIIVQVRYITIETKEVSVLDKMGFCFCNRTQIKVCYGYGAYQHFQQYYSYIVAVSFICEGNISTLRKPPICRRSLTNFITYCCIEDTSPWEGFELTTLLVICTGCTCSCKSNYHTVTTTMASCQVKSKAESVKINRCIQYFCFNSIVSYTFLLYVVDQQDRLIDMYCKISLHFIINLQSGLLSPAFKVKAN